MLVFLGLYIAAALAVTACAVFRKQKRPIRLMTGMALGVLIRAALLFLVFNDTLSVSYYDVPTAKINGTVKLALVTDLHACYYGAGQNELLTAIAKEQPDAVLLCGDLFDDRLPPDNAFTFLDGLTPAYPCYYVTGNHEFRGRQPGADALKEALATRNVHVLAGADAILTVRGDKIRVAGIDDPVADRYGTRSGSYSAQLAQLGAVTDDRLFSVFLSHRPERAVDFLPLGADLILSGHAHGGQWRIPFLLENGLLAPHQGLFPRYTNGLYPFGDCTLIVSRGLARESTIVPRIWNRPELAVITLRSNQ